MPPTGVGDKKYGGGSRTKTLKSSQTDWQMQPARVDLRVFIAGYCFGSITGKRSIKVSNATRITNSKPLTQLISTSHSDTANVAIITSTALVLTPGGSARCC